MKITYDEQADALYIQFQSKKGVNKTIEIQDGFLCDVSDDGKIFGIEILDVSQRLPIKEIGKVSIDIPIHTG